MDGGDVDESSAARRRQRIRHHLWRAQAALSRPRSARATSLSTSSSVASVSVDDGEMATGDAKHELVGHMTGQLVYVTASVVTITSKARMVDAFVPSIVTLLAVGRTIVSVSLAGSTEDVSVTVAELTAVHLAAGSEVLAVGNDMRLHARGRVGADLIPFAFTQFVDHRYRASWECSSPDVLRLEANGFGALVKAVTPGPVTLFDSDGKRFTDTFEVRVVSRFRIQGPRTILLPPGRPYEIRTTAAATFSAENATADGSLTVDPATGLITSTEDAIGHSMVVVAHEIGDHGSDAVLIRVRAVSHMVLRPRHQRAGCHRDCVRRRGGSTEFEVELRDASGDVLASIGEYDVETSQFGLDQRTKNRPRISIKGGAVGATQIVVVQRDRPTVADYATVRVVHLDCRQLGKRAMLWTTLDRDIVTVNATAGEPVGVAPGTASIMHVPSGVLAIVHVEGEAQMVDVDIVAPSGIVITSGYVRVTPGIHVHPTI